MDNKIYYYIYKITILTGKWKDNYYIGQRLSIEPFEKDTKYHGSGRKIKSWFKSKKRIEGIDYIKELICYCKDWNELQIKEDFYIGDKYDTDPLCLNLVAGGSFGRLSNEAQEKARLTLKETLNNRSKEEIEKKVEKWRKTWNSRSEAEELERYKKFKNTLDNRSQEEKQASIIKYKETMSNKSKDEKDEIEIRRFEKWKKWSDNRTYEEKAEAIRKCKETNSNKSAEQKEIEHNNRSKAQEKAWENKTQDEIDKRSNKFKETMSKKSSEEKAKSIKKQQETKSKRSKEEKEDEQRRRIKSYKKTMSKKSSEEKIEIIQKSNETKKKNKIGKITVINYSNKKIHKLIFPEELNDYLSNGWYLSVKEHSNYKLMTTGNCKPKKIKFDLVSEYELIGYYLCDRKGNKKVI